MIHVERGQVDQFGTPIEPDASWMSAADLKKPTQSGMDRLVVTDLYRDNRVRVALERLFADKCAYCETKGVAGFEWDVEHFRPKGRVAEDGAHPGYYWLAYSWTNLYLSCTFCNQRRKDKPRWNDPVEAAAAGKVDQFPLDPTGSRIIEPSGDTATEGRLLLDPWKTNLKSTCRSRPRVRRSSVTITQSGDVDQGLRTEPQAPARRAHGEGPRGARTYRGIREGWQ